MLVVERDVLNNQQLERQTWIGSKLLVANALAHILFYILLFAI